MKGASRMPDNSILQIAGNENVEDHAIYYLRDLKLSLVPARTADKDGPPFS